MKYSRDPEVKFPLVILGPLRSTDGAATGATGDVVAGPKEGAVTRATGDVLAGPKEGAVTGATGEAAAGATGGATAPAAPVVGLADNRGRAEALEPAESPPSYDSLYPLNSEPTEKH